MEQKQVNLDVLIVYSETVAESPVSSSTVPFAKRSNNQLYNEVYAYFLESCKKQGLKAAFASSGDVSGPGECKCFWIAKNGIWSKVLKKGYSSLIFDKLSPTSVTLKAQRDLLFSSDEIQPFNDPYIHQLFFDKHKTYIALKKHTIPTVPLVTHTLAGIKKAYAEFDHLMKNHPNVSDFSTQTILKDRFGVGGHGIYKLGREQLTEMMKIVKRSKAGSFILQPFTKFDTGYTYNKTAVSADIRLVYLKGKIVQTYIRMAKKDSFLCNEHQGGLLKYVDISAIPKQVLIQAKKVFEVLEKNESLFSLDFIVSNNGNSYFLEGNTGPGLDWNPNIQKNIDMSKDLIRQVVKDLRRRSDASLALMQ